MMNVQNISNSAECQNSNNLELIIQEESHSWHEAHGWLPINCWKIITENLNFQDCTRASWVSKTWNLCLEDTNVFCIQEAKFFGNGNFIEDSNLANEIALNLFRMNVANLWMNTRGLSQEMISKTINGNECFFKGFEAHLKLSRLGLSYYNDIIKFGISYEKIKGTYPPEDNLTNHWKDFIEELIYQGLKDKALQIFVEQEKKLNNEDKNDAGLSIISHLCKLNQFKEALNFYTCYFKNEHLMIDQLKNLALKKMNLDYVQELISVEPDLKGSILCELVETYNVEKCIYEDQVKFKKIISENIEEIISGLAVSLLTERHKIQYMKEAVNKYFKHFPNFIELCLDHIKYKVLTEQFKDTELNKLLDVLFRIEALELVPLTEILIAKIQIIDSEVFSSAVKFALDNNLLNLMLSVIKKSKSIKNQDLALLVEYAFKNDQSQHAEIFINSFERVNSQLLALVMKYSTDNEFINKCIFKCNDEDKNVVIKNILQLNESANTDKLMTLIDSLKLIQGTTLDHISRYPFDINFIDPFLDKSVELNNEIAYTEIIKRPKIRKHFINKNDIITPSFFILYLRNTLIEESDKINIINKVDFKNFPENLLNNNFNNFLRAQTPLVQQLIKEKLSLFKPDFLIEGNIKDKNIKQDENCAIQ